MWTCPSCGESIEEEFDACWNCGAERDGSTSLEGFEKLKAEAGVPEAIPAVTLTTAPTLDGYRVTQTFDIVTAECVFGMNLFRDLFASVTDIFGGRSQSSQQILRDARITCLSELKREAHALGANAVIAVRLDYSEFSGGGKSMLFLVASGTAVRIESLEVSTAA